MQMYHQPLIEGIRCSEQKAFDPEKSAPVKALEIASTMLNLRIC